MIKLNPYLTFPGTAAEAIEHYKKVFNAEPVNIQRFKDVSVDVGLPNKPSAESGECILHAAFQIGNDMLMISDAPEGQDDTVIMGTQMHVSIHPESKEEADRMFGLLSKEGEVSMPMATQFWGDYFGMCKDRFGVHWMINFHKEKG